MARKITLNLIVVFFAAVYCSLNLWLDASASTTSNTSTVSSSRGEYSNMQERDVEGGSSLSISLENIKIDSCVHPDKNISSVSGNLSTNKFPQPTSQNSTGTLPKTSFQLLPPRSSGSSRSPDSSSSSINTLPQLSSQDSTRTIPTPSCQLHLSYSSFSPQSSVSSQSFQPQSSASSQSSQSKSSALSELTSSPQPSTLSRSSPPKWLDSSQLSSPQSSASSRSFQPQSSASSRSSQPLSSASSQSATPAQSSTPYWSTTLSQSDTPSQSTILSQSTTPSQSATPPSQSTTPYFSTTPTQSNTTSQHSPRAAKASTSHSHTTESQSSNSGLALASESFSVDQPEQGAWKLVYMAIIIRHGARDAKHVVTFTNKDEREKWSRGYDELTPAGIEDIRSFGKKLKERYSDLLSNPSPSDIRAFSTEHGRTRTTAAVLLEEIYGQNYRQIPIHNQFKPRWDGGKMTKYNEDYKNYESSPDFKIVQQQLFRRLYPEVVGLIPDFSFKHLYKFIDTMMCEVANGVQIPDGIKKELNSMSEYMYFLHNKHSSTTLLKQSIAAPYLSDIVGSMRNIVNGQSGVPKFEIFSSHDNYVQTIIQALKPKAPFNGYFKTDFGCNISFQLWYNGQTYAVKIRYNEDTNLTNEKDVVLQKCYKKDYKTMPFCSLDEFVKAVNKYIMDPKKYTKLCEGRG